MSEKLTDQELARREKLAKLQELGVDVWGNKYDRTDTCLSCQEKGAGKTNEELEANPIRVRLAGRIMFLRKMGKASFVSIQDLTGKIQGYISIDSVGEETYEIFKLCDIGDIIGLGGHLMLTKTGSITIKVEEFTFITKALRPLPEKFHGLTDPEEKTRRRYVDLIMNEDARYFAIYRSKILRAIRSYFDNRGYMEVETSVLQPTLGGASARPFITHHNTLDKDFYLRIATELPLKRLLVGGLEKVYEIGRVFRNEGMDTKHNPEFTLLELYEAYGDLSTMGELIEGMIKDICKNVIKKDVIEYAGNQIDVSKPFKWISMTDIVKEKTGVDFADPDMTYEKAVEVAKKHNIKVEPHMTGPGHILNEMFEKYCEEELIQPTFIYGHPIEVSPLTRKAKDSRFTERFELYLGAFELANAYTELNDPIDQKERFLAQLKAKELGDSEATDMDNDFIEALEYGMPPAGGIGFGVDRLVMLLTGADSVREIILFPCLKDRG